MEPKFWWHHYESARALAGVAQRFRRHRPLLENLEDIFTYLVDTLLTLCNRRYGAHIFLNRSLEEGHYFAASHHRKSPRKYKRVKLDTSAWRRVTDIFAQQAAMNTFPGGPSLSNAPAALLCEIADCYREKIDDPDECLIVPFDYGDWDLGFFILWGTRNPAQAVRKATDEPLRSWLASYYRFVGELLMREFIVTRATYLPSFFATGWSRAAILFSDIRDFTPLTELIRHRQKPPTPTHVEDAAGKAPSGEGQQGVPNALSRLRAIESRYPALKGDQNFHRLQSQFEETFDETAEPDLLQQILREYCASMAAIIQTSERGRIDKFLGDGIMAIFGEHETDPSKSVCRAINVACRMVEAFEKLKPGLLQRVFHGRYEFEFNETVDPQLGIGINFGTVLFDYVGDDRHREYTAVGDHVNFAQRLEAEAARTDIRSGKVRPPILLSRTAYLCAKPWLAAVPKLSLTPKGKGRGYVVYGIEPWMFKREMYEASEDANNWADVRRQSAERLRISSRRRSALAYLKAHSGRS